MDTIGDLQLQEGILIRPGIRLALLVMALRRPQGMTCLLATGWQPRTPCAARFPRCCAKKST